MKTQSPLTEYYKWDKAKAISNTLNQKYDSPILKYQVDPVKGYI